MVANKEKKHKTITSKVVVCPVEQNNNESKGTILLEVVLGKMSEKPSEREREKPSVHTNLTINQGTSLEKECGTSKEEDELMRKNIKRMPAEAAMEEDNLGNEKASLEQDVKMGEVQHHEETVNQNQSSPEEKAPTKSQISYKAKLMGREENEFDKDLEELMKEWLKEEADMALALTEDHQKLLESLPKLNISNEKLKELCRPWKDVIIVTLMGKKMNLKMMKDRIFWLLKSDNFKLVDLPNFYYVFRSVDKSLCTKLLFEGPWLIQGHYLAVQRWSPNFNPYSNKVKKLAIWVRVPTLPMHVYSEECMLELGNIIGRTLKVDLNTLAHYQGSNTTVERGKFARISVEVDLNKQLQSRFVLRNRIYTVEYEGLETICFKCGRYGHNQEECLLNIQNGNHSPQTGRPKKEILTLEPNSAEKHFLFSVPGISAEEAYGTWMKAKNTFRQRSPRVEVEKKSQAKVGGSRSMGRNQEFPSGTRFEILQENDGTVPTAEKVEQSKKKTPATQWRRKDVKDANMEEDTYHRGNGQKETEETFEKWEQSGVKSDGVERAKHVSEEEKDEKVKKTKKGNEGQNNPNRPKMNESPLRSESGLGIQFSGKKRNQGTRPKIISPLLKRKQAGRAHQLVFGSTLNNGPLKFAQTTEEDKEESMDHNQPPFSATAQIQVEDNIHRRIEEKKVGVLNKPPDPTIMQTYEHTVKEVYESNDLWFETTEDAKEGLQEEEDAIELSDSGQ